MSTLIPDSIYFCSPKSTFGKRNYITLVLSCNKNMLRLKVHTYQ